MAEPATRPGSREPRPPRDTLGESEVVVAVFRTLLILMVLISPTAVSRTATTPSFYLITGLSAGYALAADVLLWKGIRFRFRKPLFLALDIGLLTLLIHRAGGRYLELFPLYYLTVVVGAMWYEWAGAIAAAALATLFSVLELLLTEPGDSVYFALRYLMLPNGLLLFLVAILCAYLAEAWRSERARAEEHQQQIRTFREQMDMAQELQKLTLPPDLPRVPGLEIGIRARQAAVVVGGDYYDAVAFADGTEAVCIADVSGKSIPGQLRLPLVKYAFRVCAQEYREPAQFTCHLARLFHEELPPEMFVTMVYVLVEPQLGRVRLTRAGHCQPLHVEARSGAVHVVEPRGMALGPIPDPVCDVVEVPFRPDDYLLLYSDGVVEATNRRDQMLGLDGLLALVREAAPESAQDLANWLFQALEDYEVGAKRDDLTLLALRRTRETGP